MRVPRVKEFDPNAAEPVLKSSFDNLPTIQKQQTGGKKARPEFYPRRKKTSPNPRPVKRRHPFDIYIDQYESLRELSIEDQKKGLSGSMSAMIRDALDVYISEKTKK